MVDDAVARTRIGDELIGERTRLLGPNHPLTLEAKIFTSGLIMDARAAYDALARACTAMADLHPGQVGKIAECANEVMLLAVGLRDDAMLRDMVGRVIATAGHGGDAFYVDRARAFAQLLDGDAAGAARAFEAMHTEAGPDGAWWVRLFNVEANLGAAHAHLIGGHPRSAATHLDTATAELAALVVRGDALARYLAVAERADAATDVAQLDGQAAAATDAAARRQYELAAEAARGRVKSLDEIKVAHERILANLTRLVAALRGVPTSLVQLQALDDQASDALTGDVGGELDRMNIELRAFEDTLATLVEVPT